MKVIDNGVTIEFTREEANKLAVWLFNEIDWYIYASSVPLAELHQALGGAEEH